MTNLLQYQLWDFAGVDGLQFAKTVVGDAAGKIAPFQSIETTFAEYPCSLLRLGEGNFRIGLHVGASNNKRPDQQTGSFPARIICN